MNKTTRTILLTALVCLLVFSGVQVGVSWGRWFGDAPDSMVGSATVSGLKLAAMPGSGSSAVLWPSEQSQAGSISIPSWNSISIPAGQAEAAVDFLNPGSNAAQYYLSFELRLQDSGELLCATGLVPPGQSIRQISLSRPLDAGSYPAVVHVQPYKMDAEQTPTSSTDMETRLVVQ